MSHLKHLFMMFVALFLIMACEQKGVEEETGNFDIEVYDLHSSHCKVKVTPSDLEASYFCGVATEEYLSTFGPLDDMHTTATNFIETMLLENSDLSVSELMKTGEYEREVTGLQPEQSFVVFVCYTGEMGEVISEVESLTMTTPALEQVDNLFEIEVDQITATSAMLFITPSTDDEYVWLEFPEFVYKDMDMDELAAFLEKNYKPFFALHTNSGEMVHSFDGALDPDTEYMIIVFGYDGGFTTPLSTKKFRTLEPNDPTDVTFGIELGTLTPRSANVTFKPSDASVSYLAIVTDEARLLRQGGTDAEAVKKLIDSQIKTAIAFGDCKDRAEFARYYAQRGEQTGSFSLKPGEKHYACAVCVDKDGNFASEVAIKDFAAPAETATDAAVTASLFKYFDGDALAQSSSDLYGEFAGWAVVRLKFTLQHSASTAVYTIYPEQILEEEGATDEEIRAILLDDEYLGTYTFLAEGLTEVQLEWGCDYKLFAIPFDANENAGEMFVMDIPALDRSGAAPVEEY